MHTGRPKHTRRAEKTGLGVEGRVTAAAANAVNPSAAERAEGMLQYSTVQLQDGTVCPQRTLRCFPFPANAAGTAQDNLVFLQLLTRFVSCFC